MEKNKTMNALLENAIDSLKVGMDFFIKDEYPYSNKHAILTIFHSIELILKEYLYRKNPILIYKNIDKPINEDSSTVGIDSLFLRLENLKIGLPEEYKIIIRKIKKRRNRIEHHRYERDENDSSVIGEALKFITYFVEDKLNVELSDHIDPVLLDNIEKTIFNYQELQSIADSRLEYWIREQAPEVDFDNNEIDIFDYFEGTLECPICNYEFLVLEIMPKPFCFYCNKEVDAKVCNDCGFTFLEEDNCPYCSFSDDSPILIIENQ
jgi:hypothetical protein